MTVPCRCLTQINGVRCHQRKSLARRPQDYIRQPKCPACGARRWYIDRYRLRIEMDRKQSCDCGGYHFIHRRGSKYCYHHPNAEINHAERYER